MIHIDIPQNFRELPVAVRGLGNDAATFGRKLWLAGLGVVATVEETATETFESMVARGKKTRFATVAEAEKAITGARRQVSKAGAKVESVVEGQVSSVLGSLGVPTRREVQELTRRVESLAASLR